VQEIESVREIWRASQNLKGRSRDPFPTPFDRILHFFVSVPGGQSARKFEVSSLNRSRDIKGSQNFKSRSRDPFPPPFDQILHFFVSAPGGQSARKI